MKEITLWLLEHIELNDSSLFYEQKVVYKFVILFCSSSPSRNLFHILYPDPARSNKGLRIFLN